MNLKKTTHIILSVVTVGFTLVAFQNCGKNFSSSSLNADGSVDSSSIGGGQSDHTLPHIVPVSATMKTNQNIQFAVNQDVPLKSPTYAWSHSIDGVPNVCAIQGPSNAVNYIINCAQNGTLKVSVRVNAAGSPVVVQDFSVAVTGIVIPPAAGLSASFNIANGTATSGWNTSGTALELYVGQTLTVTNGDTITHQMHTGGSPCPHGSSIAAGASGTCVIGSGINTVTGANAVYDHLAGSSARIYVIVHDGAALYATNCQSCHGALATSQHKNATYVDIMNARANVPQMMSNSAVQGLSAKQIEAIAYALSK